MFSQASVILFTGGEGGMRGTGACVAGGVHGGEGGVRGRRDDHCSGRHASYWNAFLFNVSIE